MRSEKKLTEVLILGIGNLLMGDEGVGARVAQHVNTFVLPEDVECLDGGTGGFHLLGPIQQAQKVILVDATVDEDPDGGFALVPTEPSLLYPDVRTALFEQLGLDLEPITMQKRVLVIDRIQRPLTD